MSNHVRSSSTKHVIVIGAGMGGLAAALDLARQGISVTLLERAATPGGKMREVNVGGANIDAGPTVFTMRWVFESLFNDAGANLHDCLTLTKASVLARHAWRGNDTNVSQLDLFADIDTSADAIGNFASAKDAAGYRQFCKRSQAIYQTLQHTYIANTRPSPIDLVRRVGFTNLGSLLNIAPFRSLWSELGQYFPDPRLQQLFGRYATYVGSSPALAPATLMLIAHVEQDGVWTVSGGMRRIADALQLLGERHGARYEYNTHVDEIVTNNGRATGVRIMRADGSVDEIRADAVVFNGDVSALASGLLGVRLTPIAKPTAPKARSLSAITWNIRAPIPTTAPATSHYTPHHHNVFFSSNYLAEFDAVFNQRSICNQPTVYVCAQDRPLTEDTTNINHERFLVLVNAPADGDTNKFSNEALDVITENTFTLMHDCGFQLDHTDALITTPDKFNALFPATGGALYGRANHGAMASFARIGAKTKIDGLYLAGGSVHPGPGVPMATLSGRLAAQQLMNDLARK
jgi:1-hydroxycarotenoid 3,4-desaturase